MGRIYSMGQKTHPLGFRLGITQEHKSAWYANLKNYADLLKEDDQIRTYLANFIKTASISNIHISRNSLSDQIKLTLETGRPGVLVDEINLNASLLGDLVVKQLEDRIPFRRAVREAMQRAQESKVNGIKVQVSGRLNGAEIARSE